MHFIESNRLNSFFIKISPVEILFEIVERGHGALGEEIIARSCRIERAHLLDERLSHLTVAESDARAPVVVYDDIAVSEEDFRYVALDLDEYEFTFVHLVGQVVADIAVDDVEVRSLRTVFVGQLLGPVR